MKNMHTDIVLFCQIHQINIKTDLLKAFEVLECDILMVNVMGRVHSSERVH
jgi:hypothetical protein